jgi:hypothetical protein
MNVVWAVPMRDEWSELAGRELAGRARPDGAWGYREGATPFVEPTALAVLALWARTRGDNTSSSATTLTRQAGSWLVSAQQPDGSLGLSPEQPTPGWMTPYAILAWKALGVQEAPATRAVEWLLGQKGRTLAQGDDPEGIAGHDTPLVGWPWVADTHSWLEPTALAVLALGVAGQGDHPRVREGLRLIRNRAVESGGWNYGNRAVFGHPLRAQPAPTGLALLALATNDPRTPTVEGGLRYLQAVLPGVRAPASLGWGLLGLRAWGVIPEASRRWLEEAYAAVAGRLDVAPLLAPLILSDARDTLRLFGRSSSVEASDDDRR